MKFSPLKWLKSRSYKLCWLKRSKKRISCFFFQKSKSDLNHAPHSKIESHRDNLAISRDRGRLKRSTNKAERNTDNATAIRRQ